MASSDPKYGGTRAGFEDSRARLRQSAGAIDDLDAKANKLGETEERVSKAQASNTRAQKGNVEARGQSIDRINTQITSLNNLAGVIERENALLRSNTALWKANSASRGESRYGSTSAGFSDTRGTLQGAGAATTAERELAGKAAAADAAAVAASQAMAKRLEEAGVRASQAERLAASGFTPPLLTPTALRAGQGALPPPRGPIGLLPPGQPGTDIVPYTGARQAATEVRQLTEAQIAAVQQNLLMQQSLKGVGREQAATNRIWRESVAEVASASQATTRHGALTAEFIQSLARGEVTLKEFQGQLVTTIGKFAGWAVAGGLVYSAFDALKHVVEGAKATATGVAQLERAGLPNFNRDQAEEGFRRVSRQLNEPIGGPNGVAEAQFYATRAGFRSQPESLKVAETALEAQKLDLVPIQDSTKAFGALHVAFGLTADEIARVFNELDVGQLKFNARLNQTLPQLGRAASSVANAGGNVHDFAQQLIAVVGATGGGGGQGGGNPATLFLREAGNISKPAAQQTLREYGFDPHKALENITAFNKELIKRSADLSPDARRSIAQAIGGGTAIGGRYAIALLNTGATGRYQQIHEEVGNPGDSVQKDLRHRLDTLDEQLKGVGLVFQNLGSELTRLGLTQVLSNIISAFHSVADVLSFVAQPAISLGHALTSLPGPLQEIATYAGLIYAAKRLAGTGIGRGLTGIADEGFLRGPERQELRNARRTTAEGLRNAKNTTEQRAREYEIRAAEADEAANEKARFAAGPGRRLGQGDLTSREQQALTARAAQYDEALASSGARAERAANRLLNTRARQLALEEQEAILTDRSLTTKQKLLALQDLNVTIAKAGVASNSLLANATGTTGTAAAARERAATEAAPGGAVLLNPRGNAAAVARETDEAALAVGAALNGAAKGTEEETVTMAEAWAEGRTRIVAGMQEVVDSLFLGAGELRVAFSGATLAVAGKGLLGGAGNVVAGGGSLLGGLFKGFGANLLKGVFSAFLIQAGGELVGNIVGGKAGSVIGSTATGAAAGAILGNVVPIIGPAVGAIGGGIIGLGKGLGEAFGGHTDPAQVHLDAVKEREEQLAGEENRAASAYRVGGRRGDALEQLARQEGLIGPGGGGKDLEQVTAEYGKELETAFKDEGDAALKSKASLEKHLKQIAATLEIYGTRSVSGASAKAELIGATNAIAKQLFLNPKNFAEEAVLLKSANDSAISQAKNELGENLKAANTPAERGEALQNFRNRTQDQYAAQQRVGEQYKGELAEREKEGQRIAVEKVQAEKEPGGKGIGKKRLQQLNERAEAVAKETGQLEEGIRRWREGMSGIVRKLNQANEEGEKETYKGTEEQVNLDLSRNLLGARGNRHLEDKAEQQAERELRAAATGLHGKAAEEVQVKLAEARNKRISKQVEDIQVEGRLAESQIPASDSAARAQAALHTAQQVYNALRSNKGVFDWKAIKEAEITLNQAKLAAAEALQQEQEQVIQLEGQLAQARDAGNAVQQAADAASVAARILAKAKTPKQRLAGEVGVAQAENQAHQAEVQRIREEGAVEESLTTDPSRQAAIKLRTAERERRAARGRDEQLQAQADVNKARQEAISARVSTKAENIDFELQMEEITKGQAADLYESLARTHGLARSVKRDYLLKARQLRQEGQNDTTFSIKPGDIKLPSIYDVNRVIEESAHRAVRGSQVPVVTRTLPQPITTGDIAAHSRDHVTAHISNENHVTIVVRDASDLRQVGEEFEKITGANLRAKRRTAGHR